MWENFESEKQNLEGLNNHIERLRKPRVRVKI